MSEPFVFTQIGFLHPNKGQDVAVQALQPLPGAFLYIVGKELQPGYAKQLSAIAHKFGVDSRCAVTGYLEDDSSLMKMIMERTSAYLYPLRAEQSTSSGLAATLPRGTLHICSRLKVFEGVPCLYCEPGSVLSLVEAMQKAMALTAEEVEICEWEALNYASKHSFERTVQAHRDLYAQLTKP